MRRPASLGVFIGRDFRSRRWCDRVRAAMEQGRATPAEIHAQGFRIDEEARRAFDVEVGLELVDEVQHSLEAIRPEVAQFFRMPLSADEGPAFLRYLAGGFYRRHCDVGPGLEQDFPRRVSVVVFLTTAGEQCEGGVLRLYNPQPLNIVPRAGTLVAFPSDLPHEVLPVTAGVREVVVDWFF